MPHQRLADGLLLPELRLVKTSSRHTARRDLAPWRRRAPDVEEHGDQEVERVEALPLERETPRCLGCVAALDLDVFTAQFRRLLRDGGVTPVRLPAQSPNLNAHAERFVGSIRRECLNKLVVLGERHLRMVLRDYIDHYLRERNHQGLGNELLTAPVSPANANAEIRCRERQGGLLKYYHREAAQRLG